MARVVWVCLFWILVALLMGSLALCSAARAQETGERPARVILKPATAEPEQREVYKCEAPRCNERGDRCTVRCFVDIVTTWSCDDAGAELVTISNDRHICLVPENVPDAAEAAAPEP